MARLASSRPVLAAAAALVVALFAAGCVSMPSGGPVISYPVTQGPDAQNQPNVQIVPQPPGNGWTPGQIVQGFLTASASFGSAQVAKQYLTPQEMQQWKPSWSALVYKSGPNVSPPSYSSKSKNQATVTITGNVQATLQGYGSYSVSSPSSPGQSANLHPYFQLMKVRGGQWRIDSAPPQYLLTSDSFANDYQLRNLYFFDPRTRFLVPDPVYVPVQANSRDLMNGLVHDLIAPPSTDWLSKGTATKTAFPPRTTISDVTLDGVTAIVNLGGAIGKISPKTANKVMQQISAQLLWTLSGSAPSGQAVQSVELEVNGKQWAPLDSQGNPVQRQSGRYNPASGASQDFYYVSSTGYLTSMSGAGSKPLHITHIGTQYSQIAVSLNREYLAALSDGTLFTGPVGGPLRKQGTGYVAMSWDVNGNLWASTGSQIVVFRASASARQPLAQPIPINVVSSDDIANPGPFTALRVAPDGVRVAIVVGETAMNFGAISWPQRTIRLSPVLVNAPGSAAFNALTWYGPDDVIAVTLEQTGSAVTEYPVSGGTPIPVPAESGIQTVTASSGQPLVAGLHQGTLAANHSLTGSWTNIDSGSSPAYPG